MHEREKISLVVLAAGRGTRFAGSDYTEHKTLIPVNGEKMSVFSMKNSVENMKDMSFDVLFLSSPEILEEDASLESDVKAAVEGVRFVAQEGYLNGPGQSAGYVRNYVRAEAPLFLVNADQYVVGDYVNALDEVLDSDDLDGAILCFNSSEDRYSYVVVDENGVATDMQEKVVISDTASAGLCFWKKASDFYSTLDTMDLSKEVFISDVHAKAIQNGKKFKVVLLDAFIDMGTPADLEVFDERWAAL
jgi:dTDP-glucose pyrophosphorylase